MSKEMKYLIVCLFAMVVLAFLGMPQLQSGVVIGKYTQEPTTYLKDKDWSQAVGGITFHLVIQGEHKGKTITEDRTVEPAVYFTKEVGQAYP
jgi:predicted RND superfamily exporter protein